MNLCRVFYKPGGKISVMNFALRARLKGETDKKFMDRIAKKDVAGTELEGLPYDDVDPATLPDRNNREKWRGEKGQGVHVDNTIVTQAEKRQALENDLDTELAKPEAEINIAKTAKLQRKLQKGDYD